MMRWYRAGRHHYTGVEAGTCDVLAYVFRPPGSRLWSLRLAGAQTISRPYPSAKAAQDEAEGMILRGIHRTVTLRPARRRHDPGDITAPPM